MTESEFLEALGKTPRTWRIEGRAVRNGNCCCPIEAVFDVPANTIWSPSRAHERFGLSHGQALSIMHAADGDDDHDKALRARLLTACGLKEESR